MSIVDQTRQGDVLVLTINNPPVNAFSPGVPEVRSQVARVSADLARRYGENADVVHAIEAHLLAQHRDAELVPDRAAVAVGGDHVHGAVIEHRAAALDEGPAAPVGGAVDVGQGEGDAVVVAMIQFLNVRKSG